MIEEPLRNEDDEEEARAAKPSAIRKAIRTVERTASDEDSDFD